MISEDIDHWLGEIDVLHKVKLASEKDLVERRYMARLQKIRGTNQMEQ